MVPRHMKAFWACQNADFLRALSLHTSLQYGTFLYLENEIKDWFSHDRYYRKMVTRSAIAATSITKALQYYTVIFREL